MRLAIGEDLRSAQVTSPERQSALRSGCGYNRLNHLVATLLNSAKTSSVEFDYTLFLLFLQLFAYNFLYAGKGQS